MSDWVRSAILLSLMMSALGCHSFSSRWRGTATAVDTSNDDDWAPPKTSRYTQPQQYVRRPKTSSAEPLQTAKPTASAHLSEGGSPNQAVEARKPATDDGSSVAKTVEKASQASPAPNIQETDDQSLDIDGAVAALPPNLRDVGRRQLEAIRNANSASNAVDDQVNRSSTTSMREPPALNRSSAASEPPAAAVAATETPISNPSLASPSKVSAKLSDQDGSEVVPASHVEPLNPLENKATASSTVASATAVSAGDNESVVPASAASLRPSAAGSHWSSPVNEAIEKLERALEDNRGLDENLRLSQELTLRMLYLANRQLDDAMRPIEGLDATEQDYFRHQFQALYEAGNPDAMPVRSRRWSLVMNSQRQATNQLAAASNLEVRSLAFCTDVQGYGVITKFPNYQFQPDQEILLYCELDNVLAEQVKAGFETQLQGTYEIIDPSGRRVADQLLPMEQEICQNHRRDYFIIYHIFMPMQIAPGNYQMRVTIEDMKARKFGQANLDFQIQKK